MTEEEITKYPLHDWQDAEQRKDLLENLEQNLKYAIEELLLDYESTFNDIECDKLYACLEMLKERKR